MTARGRLQRACWFSAWLVAGCSGPGDRVESVDQTAQAVGACGAVSLELSQASPLLQDEPITLVADAAGCADPRYFFSVRTKGADGSWSPWAGLQRGPNSTLGPIAYSPGQYQFRVRAKEKGAPGFHLLAKKRFEWCDSLDESGACAPAPEESCTWWDRDVLGVGTDPVLASGANGYLTLVAGRRIVRYEGSQWERVLKAPVEGSPLHVWQAATGPLFLAVAHDKLECDQPEDCTGGSVCSDGTCEPQWCDYFGPPHLMGRVASTALVTTCLTRPT